MVSFTRTSLTGIHQEGFKLFDEVENLIIKQNQVAECLDKLILGLNDLRQKTNEHEWTLFAKNKFFKHPLTRLIHQCPYTKHSFEQLRGYAGDADLLDYIYHHRDLPSNTTELGKEISQYCINVSSSDSVRIRKDILASTIDRIANDAVKPPKILSIACGHLREAETSQAVAENAIEEFIAIDQDPLSIQLLELNHISNNIKPICASVIDLIRHKLEFNNFDLVYAAGLYDYLPLKIAKVLTRTMFSILKPGGQLLIANFTPNLRDIGYMETFMRWNLIYRTPEEFEFVTDAIDHKLITNKYSFLDKYGNITYLQITKG